MPSIVESPSRGSLDEATTQIDTTKGEWAKDIELGQKKMENVETIEVEEEYAGKASDEQDRQGKGNGLVDEETQVTDFGAGRVNGRRRAWSEAKFTDLEEKGNPLG